VELKKLRTRIGRTSGVSVALAAGQTEMLVIKPTGS
jgi:hypothetical protein